MSVLIVKSGVEDAFENQHVFADRNDALDENVVDTLEEGARRADANGR